MSKALQLRSRALMMSHAGGLDLTGKIDLPAAIMKDLEPDLAKAGRVLVAGCSLTGLADKVVRASSGQAAQVDVVDGEVDLAEALPGGGGGLARHVRGPLDDYATDSGAVDRDLREKAVASFDDLRERLAAIEVQRRERPLVPDGTKALVVQDLLANRLGRAAFRGALAEAFRVLAREGMLYLTALLADEPLEAEAGSVAAVSAALVRLPLERDVLEDLRQAGFHGLGLTLLHEAPVVIRNGVEVRAFAVRAYKGTQGPCYDQGHAVMYKGPWSQVADDDNHVYRRGERTAVCRKTYDVLMRAPYREQFVGLPSYQEPPLSEAALFDCNTPALRDPAVTKGRRPLRDAGDAGPASAAPSCGDGSSGGGCC